ncbi:response regulator [Kiloniella laminariae]|uniref:response regulator n=1 Tax=Kiloniella laminariae TaxID=454162 RepID=UPI00035D7EE3|nr:response regulator [Kiloniella laminariae]
MSGYDLSALNVMVIDDNVHMLRIVKTIFHAMAISRVRYLSNAKDAYAELRRAQPDIIITDWEMKPVNGLEFTRQLRSKGGYYSRVPIILLTGHTEYERVMEAIQSGVSDVLAKPVSIEILYRRLCRIVDISAVSGADDDNDDEYIDIG